MKNKKTNQVYTKRDISTSLHPVSYLIQSIQWIFDQRRENGIRHEYKLFADDKALFIESEDLQNLFNKSAIACQDYGMALNVKKRKRKEKKKGKKLWLLVKRGGTKLLLIKMEKILKR